MELSKEQQRVLTAQYSRYVSAQQVAQREARVLEDLCVALAGRDFELRVENGIVRLGVVNSSVEPDAAEEGENG